MRPLNRGCKLDQEAHKGNANRSGFSHYGPAGYAKNCTWYLERRGETEDKLRNEWLLWLPFSQLVKSQMDFKDMLNYVDFRINNVHLQLIQSCNELYKT